MNPPVPVGLLRRLRGPLLAWYRRNRRDLPWRRTRDPYAIWVSEIMLQQTRVEAVIPHYERFLRRFPDLRSLARASEDEVLAAWSGLGYYRRARALREAAIAVLERHGGTLPDDPSTLRELPGVGRYTAGAIASLAFDLEEPVVDGNVRRVLCRVAGFRPTGARETERIWDAAGVLVRGATPGELNQALMELGATVCTPRSPDCGACPWRRRCRAYAGGDPESFPPRRSATRPTAVRVAVAVIRRGRSILLERRDGATPLRGRFDLPAREIGPDDDPAAALREALAGRGVTIVVEPPIASVAHAILDRRLDLVICPARPRGRARSGDDLRWVERRALDDVPVSGATRKVLRTAEPGQNRSQGGTQVASGPRRAGRGGGSSGPANR